MKIAPEMKPLSYKQSNTLPVLLIELPNWSVTGHICVRKGLHHPLDKPNNKLCSVELSSIL